MRVLTVRQPWAWAIINGGKDVENRTRNIAGAYRGPVAIHAAARLPKFEEHWDSGTVIAGITGRRPLFHGPWSLGTILGVVDLVDVHLGSQLPGHCWDDKRGMRDRCSQWGQDDTVHLVLANPRPIADPIPYKGALGLRHIDAATAIAIYEAIA
jgi:hypothetical protein